jgi:uncharacterized protein DUF6655
VRSTLRAVPATVPDPFLNHASIRNSRKPKQMTARVVIPLLALGVCLGCGTTKWTDTSRSATEQLLISDAMDRAVSRLEFRALAGKTVFIDDTPVKTLSDTLYLVSCLRQHMLASGCIVKENREEADYIAEIRAGAVGTDRHELLYGVPAVNIPTLVPVSGFGVPSQIPEIPFVKKTDQRAVVKIAIFAYNRTTGRPVWQSGIVPVESDAKAIWVFGAGPFQRGSIYDGMSFAGDKLNIPLVDLGKKRRQSGSVSVADEAYFIEPGEAPETELARGTEKPPEQPSPPLAEPQEQPAPETAEPVVQASHAEKVDPAPAPSTASSEPEDESRESEKGQASSGEAEAPAALRQTNQPPSSTSPNSESAASGNPTPGALPATADPFQDGTGKDSGNDDHADRPATLAYPAGLFAPDQRRTAIR